MEKSKVVSRDKAPFLGIHFHCCNIYARLWRNTAGTAYEGRCPRCLRPLRMAIGPGGTKRRFFGAM